MAHEGAGHLMGTKKINVKDSYEYRATAQRASKANP